MIFIDDRIGSKDLLPLFPKNMATLTRLQFGDCSFLGRGPDDCPIPIGIERKKIMDLVDCLLSGRLSGHQLPGLTNSYELTYLIIEGIWRPNPKSGILEKLFRRKWAPISIGQRSFMAREIYNYLHSLSLLGGVMLWTTASDIETAYLIQSLYHWWNDKSFSAHSSHSRSYTPFVGLNPKIPIIQKVALQLPGIGPEKAKLIVAKFPSILDMVLASEKDWQSVEGVGKKLSANLTKILQGW